MQEAAIQQGETFSLEQRVVIQDVAELRGKLKELREDKENIVVGASAVESIDTAGLQLLTAFVRSCEDLELSFGWSSPSQVFLEKAELLGLSDALGLDRYLLESSGCDDNGNDDNNNETEIEDDDADGLLPVF